MILHYYFVKGENDVLGTESAALKRPLENVMEGGPPAKQSNRVDEQAFKQMRLPNPCPLPATFSGILLDAISKNKLKGNLKTRLLRECAAFLQGICPHPRQHEYVAMAKAICDKYEDLKDIKPNNGEYWVKLKKDNY